ncbi:hypothetical protein SDC9_199790 [bioreactor metagenome]|uniref:YdhG-like domain-containing protein n=1 Tax=bioreactor metagenome TaxID=1076179 RepID=A0A645IM68_9ZZZZ
MWKCPECGKIFPTQNQDHSCAQAQKTVEEYISAQSESVRLLLHRVRETLRAALPDAQECISWGMPTYRDKRNIIHFAAFKNHIGVYPGPEAIEHFADQLSGYKSSKGAVQLPYSEPLPLDLIAEMAVWCRATGHHH